MSKLTLETSVQFLRSVGPVRARALARLGIASVGDLLTHYPRRYFDRSQTTALNCLKDGQEVTVAGTVLTAGERRTQRGGRLQTVSVGDGSGVIFCLWFNQRYILKTLRRGKQVIASGTVQRHRGRWQMTHPDFELLTPDSGESLHTGRLVPIYPLTQGVGQRWLRGLVHDCLDELPKLVAETLPADIRRRHDLCGREEALRGIHFPASAEERDRARRRLVYEELFLIQLVMALRRSQRDQDEGIILTTPGDLTRRLVEGLPFALTAAQRRVLKEILADLRSGRVMHRLLQGDVGCGKTLVALIATLFVIEQGYQAVFVAPTEVLARQHGYTLRRLTKDLGVRVATLTGSTTAARRREVLAEAAAGEVDLLVGTHAIFEDRVFLPALGLAVVDEQHRFGVRQRGRSARLGGDRLPAHVLVMSATPIPRSLALTLYGDLDLSVIDELPAQRRPVRTRLLPDEQEDLALRACEASIDRGQQVFVIYPVIEQTSGQDLKTATAEYERLAGGVFARQRTALLHGRLKGAEKDAIMKAFAAGEIDLLVATTVVEVGIDVPNACVMVIHHPERFGLAQLHQLRGRVGRGAVQAECYLVHDRLLPTETLERVRYFATHNDGFALAEEDLRRRGPGDIWGVRQHGMPGFILANPLRDRELVALCSEDARSMLSRDPELASAAGRNLRQLLSRNFDRLFAVAAG